MTILRESGRQQRVCCDECGAEHDEFDQSEFGRMIEAAKAEGWQIVKVGDLGWRHTCPDCIETPLERAKRLFGSPATH